MPEMENSARWERRPTERKEEILEAAARLFSQKGFPRTTTREIANAAAISEGTIYKYFNSKEDILTGIMSHLAEAEQIEQIRRRTTEDLHTYLVQAVRFRQSFEEEHYDMLKAVFSELLVNAELNEHYFQQLLLPALESAEKIMQGIQQTGTLRDVDERLMVRIIMGAFYGVFLLREIGDPLLQPGTDSYNQLPDTFATILVNGLLAQNTVRKDENT